MEYLNASVSAGGLLFKNDEVLLVQVTYGSNKGMWMIPGGYLEAGENIEETAVRELEEETGIKTVPKRIIGIRSGVRKLDKELESSVYVVFEMEYVSGSEKADGEEISKAQFRKIKDVLEDREVIDLSKEFIRSAIDNKGLLKAEKN